MRNTICPAILAILPNDLKSVIGSCTKYSHNAQSDNTDTSTNVTATSESLFLLSEFEVKGQRFHANNTEKDRQSQYSYFTNGNSSTFYKHNASSTSCTWHTRSVYVTSGGFVAMSYMGGIQYVQSNSSSGFVPCFVIG